MKIEKVYSKESVQEEKKRNIIRREKRKHDYKTDYLLMPLKTTKSLQQLARKKAQASLYYEINKEEIKKKTAIYLKERLKNPEYRTKFNEYQRMYGKKKRSKMSKIRERQSWLRSDEYFASTLGISRSDLNQAKLILSLVRAKKAQILIKRDLLKKSKLT